MAADLASPFQFQLLQLRQSPPLPTARSHRLAAAPGHYGCLRKSN